MEFTEHADLSSRTTFGVGGRARYLGTTYSVEGIKRAFDFAHKKTLPIILLGGGSNLLADDGEAEAIFLASRIHSIELEGQKLRAGASDSWDEVVERAVSAGLYGIENLSGIPGTVGGAVVQNIGAYGKALSEVISLVEVFDTKIGESTILTRGQCKFGYRDSIFKEQEGRYIVLRIELILTSVPSIDISYKDLVDFFKKEKPQLRAVRDAVLAIRAAKFPDLRLEGTAGSFFKNPIVSKAQGNRLLKKYPKMPLFKMPETTGYKVPLAWILDKALSMRGFSIGPVRCFEMQPLVITAQKGATASDVRAFAGEVSKRVLNECGIAIEPEVCIMKKNKLVHTIDF